MLDEKLVAAYRAERAPRDAYGHTTHWPPARYALGVARATLEHAEVDRRFAALGALMYADVMHPSRVERAYNDFGNARPLVRLVYFEEQDYEPYFDYDCCDGDEPCDCVLDRSTNSHASPRARLNKHNGMDYHVSYDEAYTGRRCRYDQPCRHKCEEAQRVDRDGLQYVRAEYRTAEGNWVEADSLGCVTSRGMESDISELKHAALRGLVYGQSC